MEQRKHEKGRIRLMIADDHTILRHGLAAVLAEEPDFEFVSFAEFDHDEDLRQSLKAWAKGYLLKDAAREEIAESSVCLV